MKPVAWGFADPTGRLRGATVYDEPRELPAGWTRVPLYALATPPHLPPAEGDAA